MAWITSLGRDCLQTVAFYRQRQLKRTKRYPLNCIQKRTPGTWIQVCLSLRKGNKLGWVYLLLTRDLWLVAREGVQHCIIFNGQAVCKFKCLEILFSFLCIAYFIKFHCSFSDEIWMKHGQRRGQLRAWITRDPNKQEEYAAEGKWPNCFVFVSTVPLRVDVFLWVVTYCARLVLYGRVAVGIVVRLRVILPLQHCSSIYN